MSDRAAPRACALCGTPCRAPFVPPAAETSPDLDLRPGEPTRSTLARWVQTCRGCGACAPDLAQIAPAARAVVESADYKAIGGPARAFLRWAMIAESESRLDPSGGRVLAEAGQAMLEAAWMLDDAQVQAGAGGGSDSDQAAVGLRQRAAALWGEPATMQDALRLVDVLRRGGAFDAAAARTQALLARSGLDETDAAVLRYQQERIGAGDTARHLLSSALRPPAQRPHVTQNKPKPGGLWRRLVGK